jgi:hypothetical protein
MFLRRVAAYGVVPRGFRPVWWYQEGGGGYSGGYVCAPFGLHWILRAGYRLWTWTFKLRKTAFDEKQSEAFGRGFKAGKRAAEIQLRSELRGDIGPPEGHEPVTAAKEASDAQA